MFSNLFLENSLSFPRQPAPLVQFFWKGFWTANHSSWHPYSSRIFNISEEHLPQTDSGSAGEALVVAIWGELLSNNNCILFITYQCGVYIFASVWHCWHMAGLWLPELPEHMFLLQRRVNGVWIHFSFLTVYYQVGLPFPQLWKPFIVD